MADVVARLKVRGKFFEIIVDCDKATVLKKQKNISPGTVGDVLAIDTIYKDYKKGFKASSSDIAEAFGTEDPYEITAKILLEGEIQLPIEYREKEREAKFKQIVDFLSKNCIDPRTKAPYTAERISSALKQAGAKIDENCSADEQALHIINDIRKILPIKIATIKLKVTIPPAHVGKIYNLFKIFKKDKEDWISDGSLVCIINLPAGMQLDFYDKLNAITHGEAITEEIEE